ncbi:MAG: hypothetical protein OXG36_07965, partial [Caldilineaceae bacterium]|nr:hypothetical protein [Caldilineaceae bacterium]
SRAWAPPTVAEAKEPAGGWVTPCSPYPHPQQTIEPSVRTPQVYLDPVLTIVKVSAGGLD